MWQLIHKMFIILFIFLYFGTIQTYCNPTTTYSAQRYLDYDSTTKMPKYHRAAKTELDWVKEIFNTTVESTTQKQIRPRTLSDIDLQIKIQNQQPMLKKNISSKFYYKLNVTNYPDLSQIEEQLKKFQHLFNTDSASGADLEVKTLNLVDEHEYTHLCGNTVEYLNPRELKNTKGEIVQIVNYPKYEQAIRAETCGNELDTPCNNHLNNLHLGYTPMCKQNYISRRMVIFKDDGKVDKDDIAIPGCCECVLKRNGP